MPRRKQAHPGRGSNANNHRPRRSAPAADGMKRFLVRVPILEIAGSAMPRRARPRNGERRGLVNEREHATPLHLLHPGLRRLNPPIPGEYRETHDQRHDRTPMAPRYPRRGPLPSGLAPLYKRYIILGDRGRTVTSLSSIHMERHWWWELGPSGLYDLAAVVVSTCRGGACCGRPQLPFDGNNLIRRRARPTKRTGLINGGF